MPDQDSMRRTTFTNDKKYFIRAEANWFTPRNKGARIIVSAEVFKGNPEIAGNECIYFLDGKAETTDLLDALQSVEAFARRYIDALPG